MTGSNALLDTSIVIEVFNGNRKIANKVNDLNGFCICSVVLGELYIGINKVANKAKHLKMLDDFLELCTVLDVDGDTAEHYGAIMAALHKKGKPIPTNDVWIAAVAKQHKCRVVTKDKHFDEIAGVKVLNW
jgi:tRNA(fMet)-specific endonuclease VapC